MTLLKRAYLVTGVLLVTVHLAGAVAENMRYGEEQGADDADEVARFYDGARLRWIVPYSPGGGYDEYARLIAPYLEKYTGARVDVFNMPGAGGMRGANELFNVPNDGKSIGIINGSALVMSELAGVMENDVRDLEYLARVVADSRVLVVSQHSPHDTFAEIMKSPGNFNVGATGLGGSTYLDAVVVNEAFELHSKLVHGFDSSSVLAQAMLRGNIHGRWGSWGSAEESVDSDREHVVLQSGRERNPEIPHAPTALELVDSAPDPDRAREILNAWEALNAVGRPVAAPPGTPPERVAFLRDAFARALNDPDLRERVMQIGRPIRFLPGEEVEQVISEALDMPADVKPLFVDAIRGGV